MSRGCALCTYIIEFRVLHNKTSPRCGVLKVHHIVRTSVVYTAVLCTLTLRAVELSTTSLKRTERNRLHQLKLEAGIYYTFNVYIQLLYMQ